jgi:hypothetical protein
MEKGSFLVLGKPSKTPYFADTQTYLISTKASNKKPFFESFLIINDGAKLGYGDLIWRNFGSKLVEEIVPYNMHSYELATVIGVEKEDLLLCGEKIGKKIIKNYPAERTILLTKYENYALFGIQRGDELLLDTNPCSKHHEFDIIHNITQEKLRYAAEHRRYVK